MKCRIDRNAAIVRLTKVVNCLKAFMSFLFSRPTFCMLEGFHLQHGLRQFYFERASCEQTTRVAPPEGFFKLVYELNAWAASAVFAAPQWMWKCALAKVMCVANVCCMFGGRTYLYAGQSSSSLAKYLPRWRKRDRESSLRKGGKKKLRFFLIPALVSSVNQLVSLLSGWLISSHHCLLSRRRSSLTLLRGSWLQERGSWLLMSPQVEPPILPQVTRGGRQALRQCIFDNLDCSSFCKAPWESVCRRSTWRTLRRTAATSATSSSPLTRQSRRAWAASSSSTRRSTRSQTVASSSLRSSRRRASSSASRWAAG